MVWMIWVCTVQVQHLKDQLTRCDDESGTQTLPLATEFDMEGCPLGCVSVITLTVHH